MKDVKYTRSKLKKYIEENFKGVEAETGIQSVDDFFFYGGDSIDIDLFLEVFGVDLVNDMVPEEEFFIEGSWRTSGIFKVRAESKEAALDILIQDYDMCKDTIKPFEQQATPADRILVRVIDDYKEGYSPSFMQDEFDEV